jgi:hypothetical protein
MTRRPRISIKPNTGSYISSCTICGAASYEPVVGKSGPDSVRPNGFKLWEVALCANGYQGLSFQVCRTCAKDLAGGLDDLPASAAYPYEVN